MAEKKNDVKFHEEIQKMEEFILLVVLFVVSKYLLPGLH